MTILLPTLAAAFCIWPVVRIVNRREPWAIALAAIIGILIYIEVLIFCFSGRQPPSGPPSTWID